MSIFWAKRIKLHHLLLTALFVLVGVLLLRFSSYTKQGALSGLILCSEILIPSLFLFSAFSYFIFLSPAISSLGVLLDGFSKKVFSLSGKEFSVFLLSLISGYPMGAILVNKLYSDGETDKIAAQRMLGFTVNSGPAFMVVAIGEVMLGSKSDGYRLLVCHLLTSLLLAFFTKFGRKDFVEKKTVQKDSSLSDCFVLAVSKSAEAMLNICGFTVVFSCVGSLLFGLLRNETANIIIPFLDVTVGVLKIARRSNLPLISFFLSFAGMSVISQVLFFAKDIKISFFKILVQRIRHGSISFVLCAALNKLFPRTVQTMLGAESVTFSPTSLSVAGSFFLILLCIFYLLFLSRKEKESGHPLKKMLQ